MRLGSFPRFLHKTTYSNIGKAELAQRINMAIMGFLFCAAMIPVALTQSWYGRNFRLFLALPIFLFLSGLVVSTINKPVTMLIILGVFLGILSFVRLDFMNGDQH